MRSYTFILCRSQIKYWSLDCHERYKRVSLFPISWSKAPIFVASTITQYWLDNTIITIFFSDNSTIIYWMKETNSCFLRIASKAPMRIQLNLYTAFEWITYKISFFPNECFVRKWRLKFLVSKYLLRWLCHFITLRLTL